MIRILLIPSSDYLGHPFLQRHNHLFEMINGDYEIHVVRFNIFNGRKNSSKCIIHEFPMEVHTGNAASYYLANAFMHAKTISELVRRESIDIVVAGNLLPPLLYKLVKELSSKKVPFVFDLQDYYPTSGAGYILMINSLLEKTIRGSFEAITQFLIRSADVVTTPGNSLAMYADRVGAKRVHLIPNGISEYFLIQEDGKEVRKKLGFDDDDIVVGYIGSMEFWLDMKTLIEGVAKANKNVPVKLLLIGRQLHTDYQRKIDEWIKMHGLSRITSQLGFIPHEKVPRHIAAMDVGTIPFDPGNPTAYYAAPNKLWEYLSQKRLVLASPIPETVEACKYLVLTRTSDDYAKALTKAFISDNSDKIEQGYKKAQLRTWGYSAGLFYSLLKDLVKSTS